MHLHNPPINLFSIALARDLSRCIEEINSDDEIRVVVFISDVDAHFIQHLDLAEVLSGPVPPRTLLKVLKLLTHLGCPGRSLVRRMLEGNNPPYGVINQISRLPQITISCVEGRVGGGGNELIMATDMRFAAEGAAIICQLEAALGVFPGYGGTHRLSRLIGMGPAMEIIAASDDIDPATAEIWGYYNRVLPKDKIRGFVEDLAFRIAAFPAQGLVEAKRNVHNSIPLNEKTLLLENLRFAELVGAEARSRTVEFLESGGQEPEGAKRIGELFGKITERINGRK